MRSISIPLALSVTPCNSWRLDRQMDRPMNADGQDSHSILWLVRLFDNIIISEFQALHRHPATY